MANQIIDESTDTTASVLNNNSIAFIGLSKEYCETLENVAQMEDPHQLTSAMVRLLPRLYITASDLHIDMSYADEAFIDSVLEEDYYDSVRRSIEALLGEDDVYLEVFEEDMKYSDTPVSASIAEGLCDIFQALYNFMGMIRGGDVTDETLASALIAIRDDFHGYWSKVLCNVLRAVNRLYDESYTPED